MTLAVLWSAADPSAGGAPCVRSVDAAAAADAPAAEAALRAALGDAAAGVIGGCTDWTVQLTGTFALTSQLVWGTAVPMRLVGPADSTARIAAPAGARHRLLTVDTFPTEVVVTLERLVLAGGNVAFGAIGADEGGAVLADVLHLLDVELVGNAAVVGGAVSTLDLRAERTSFVRNEAEFSDGQGGAVFATRQVVLDNVTFSGNVAGEGGALFMDLSASGASLTATFVTFVGNEASTSGSGADLHLDAANARPVTLRGVLFGGPGSGSEAGACGGSYDLRAGVSGLIWTASFATDTSCGAPQASVLPAFDTVSWLPGTTPLPRPGPGAVSTGAVACGAGWPTTDQRGAARPQGAACDAGAVERLVAAPPDPEPAPAPEAEPAPDGSGPVEGAALPPVPTSIPAGGGACADGCPPFSRPGAPVDVPVRQR